MEAASQRKRAATVLKIAKRRRRGLRDKKGKGDSLILTNLVGSDREDIGSLCKNF